jgi:hypothetical protein
MVGRIDVSTPKTKPGKYGTLYRYAIRYGDPGEEIGTWHTWAYSPEHALDNFYCTGDDDGFVPIAYAVCNTENAAHRMHWHPC